MIHDMGQKDSLCVSELDEQDRSFDVVRVKYINLSSINSIILTMFKSSMGQKQTQIVYKIKTGANGNVMPFKIFKNLFPKLALEQLHATRDNAMVLKYTIFLF